MMAHCWTYLPINAFFLVIAHGVRAFKVSKTRAVSLVIKQQLFTTKKVVVDINGYVVLRLRAKGLLRFVDS